MDKKRQEQTPFFTALKQYVNADVTPCDIPGHKLGRLPNELLDAIGQMAFRYDANAPKGLDNLNRPTGVIKEAQDLMAEAYGADRAYFLTGGTSLGIIAMIMSTCNAYDKIILPRNVHKSIISGLILSGAVPVFLPTNIDASLGISNGVAIEDVISTMEENPDAKAILIINPTYFGVASNIKEIASEAHKRGMLMLADEAHGAHLPFSSCVPSGAILAGADASACSLHKTVGSLTQSSVLLARGNRINYNKIRVTLNMLQSTSPSSLLMASLDVARKFIVLHGDTFLKETVKLASIARDRLNAIPGIEVADKTYFQARKNYDYDETKLLINIRNLGKPGYYIYNLLKDDYNIQVELAETYVILIVLSMGSTMQDIEKLVDAFDALSKRLYDGSEKEPYQKFEYRFPTMFERPRVAFHAPKKFVKLEDAINEISGESLMIYPPGIPLVIPGEIIDQGIVDMITFYKENGFTILSEQEDDTVKVIDKEKWIKWSEYDEI